MADVIEKFFDYFSRVTGIMMEQRLLGAVVIMALFAILAVLVDFFIHRIVNFIRKRSNVDIDNTFIGSIHRPAWIVLVLIGALLSATWLKLDPRINYIVNAILKTLPSSANSRKGRSAFRFPSGTSTCTPFQPMWLIRPQKRKKKGASLDQRPGVGFDRICAAGRMQFAAESTQSGMNQRGFRMPGAGT